MSGSPRVLMYSTAVCPFCIRAEQLLHARGVTEIEKIRIDLDPGRRDEMVERTTSGPSRRSTSVSYTSAASTNSSRLIVPASYRPCSRVNVFDIRASSFINHATALSENLP